MHNYPTQFPCRCAINRLVAMSDKLKTQEKPIGRPFQPGCAPGPGRPRKRPLSDAYAEQLRTTFPLKMCKALGIPLGSTWAEALTEVAFRTALKSTEVGVSQRKEIREAIEGKAPVRYELRQDGEIEFRVVYEQPLQRHRLEDEKKIIDVEQLAAPGEDESSDK